LVLTFDLNLKFLSVADFDLQRVYHLYGYTINLESIPPVISSGDYKLQFKIELDGQLVNGYNLFVHFINMAG
jgi:hypothetical protein